MPLKAVAGRSWELAIGSSEFEAEVDLAYQAALRSAEDTDGLLNLGTEQLQWIFWLNAGSGTSFGKR